MNFVRRRPGNDHSREIPSGSSAECAHLGRLFSQYRQIQDVSEQEQMFYELLPVFHGVLANCKPTEFIEKFPDIHAFCSRATQIIVKEIKSRASNQTSEEGSRQIFLYLEPPDHVPCEKPSEAESADCTPLNVESRGWNLLSCLNVLSSGHMSLIECMVAASLPSTLVKCMYIFLDLPRAPSPEKAYTFQSTFKQITQRLCMYPIAVEELARKDALCHLFSASTDWCPSHNIIWRSTTASILSTIAQNGMTTVVVKYIHDAKCISECIKNISQGRLAPLEILDGFIALLHILCESSSLSHVLLDDFSSSNGYSVTTEFILKLEQNFNYMETKMALQTIVSLLERLVVCGALELRPKPGAGEQIHAFPGFRVPMPKSAAMKSVRNILAFDVLQSLFLSASTKELSMLLLDSIKTIYLQDSANYFILEQQNTLVLFVKKIYHKPTEIQESFFNLIEVLVNRLHYVPMKEISSIVVLMKTCSFNSCLALTLRHLIRLLGEHRLFKEVYHDVGLLELSVELLHRFADLFGDPPETNTPMGNAENSNKNGNVHAASPEFPVAFEVGQLLIDFLRLTVSGSVPNADMCLRLGLANCVAQRLLPSRSPANTVRWRRHALAILEEITLTNGGEQVMPLLLSKMHTTYVDLKIEILQSFCRVLRDSHRCRMLFRKVNGFVYVMQELINLESCLNPRSRMATSATVLPVQSNVMEDRQHPISRDRFLASLTYEHIFKLIRIIFTVFGIAMKFEPANAHYFATEIQYSNITDAIVSLGSFNTSTYSEYELLSGAPDSLYEMGDKGNTIGHNLFTSLFRNLNETEAVLLTVPTAPTESLPPFITFHAPLDLVDRTTSETPLSLSVPRRIVECCVLTRYLYNLAVDAYDKRSVLLSTSEKHPAELPSKSVVFPPNSKSVDSNSDSPCPAIVHPGAIISLLHLTAKFDRKQTDQTAHTGILDIDLQTCLLDVISDLLRIERNQQLLCTVQMPRELITLFRHHLANEDSPLHDRIQSLFECLVVQSLNPNDLREYLRISEPMCCRSPELVHPSPDAAHDRVVEIMSALQNAGSRYGGPLPLSQIKFLIATATPVNAQLVRPAFDMKSLGFSSHADQEPEPEYSLIRCALVPPFVEFDMNPEGFGCLFLPSIAPQGPSSVANLSGATTCSDLDEMTGGVGIGERLFPPPHGFTFSTWVCVSQFDKIRNSDAGATSASSDVLRSRAGSQPPAQQPQAVHLLTIVRGIQSVNDQLICLRIFIHPYTRMLVVSTQERLAQPDQTTNSEVNDISIGESDRRPSTTGTTLSMDSATTSSCAVFPCGLPNSTSQQWPVGVWRHLAVVFSRAGMIKSSSCSVYLDGQLVGLQRLNYIGSSAAVSGFLGRQTMPSTVCAFVGTPATERRPSALIWRQGPMHFMEEPLQANRIALIARLGPNYFGSFQSPPPVFAPSSISLEEPYHPLLSEEKLVFGIYASTLSTLTLSRFRKIYSQADTKAVARQFYIAPKENVTPIRVLHNSAAHLHGPARPLGAVLVGYQGVRAFTPNPIVRQLHCVGGGVGGIRIGLALIAMAQDAEMLYAATKAACTLIRSSPAAANEMCITRGYQMLAMLLRKKRNLLTTRILDIILGLTMHLDSWMDGASQEQVVTAEHPAFEDLLCDLDLWRIERERIESPAKVTADQSALNSEIVVVEEDYRLVANLLNHLVELLSVTSSRNKRESVDSCNSNGSGRPVVTYRCSLHPTWDMVFDRVFYLLLSAYQTLTGPVFSQSRPGVLTKTLTSERQSMLDASMRFFHIYFSYSVPNRSLLRIAQLMAWTLPSVDVSESIILLEESSRCNASHSSETNGWRQQLIGLRNACFRMLLKLIVNSPSVNKRFCNELLTVVGFDWFHLFLRPNVHPSSVVLAFHLLILVILNPDYSVTGPDPLEDWLQDFATVAQTKLPPSTKLQHDNSASADGVFLPNPDVDGLAAFRTGCPAGRWLRGCEALLKRQHGLLLDNVPRNTKYISARFLTALRDFRLTACQQPGFGVLRLLLPQHSNVPELYYLLTALLLQLPVRQIPSDFRTIQGQKWIDKLKLEFDSLYSLLSNRKDSSAFHPLAGSDQPADITNECTTSSLDISASPQSINNSPAGSAGGIVTSFLTAAGFGRKRTRILSGSDSNADVVCSDANTAAAIRVGPPFCPEAANLLLALIRNLLLLSKDFNLASDSNWAEDYSDVILRFFIFLYRSNLTFRSIAMNPEFVNGLVGIVISASVCQGSQKIGEPIPRKCQHPPPSSQEKSSCVILKVSLEFLKIIVSDSFMLPPSYHQPTNMVDTLLDALSDHCRSKQYDELGTDVLCELMEHFMATDLLTDERLCVPTGGDRRYIPPQLVYFCARVVDKLWQGSFCGQVIKVVDFLDYLITQWPTHRSQVPAISCSGSEQTDQRFGIESLFRSLNRAILYQFSRPILTQTDQLQLLELFRHIWTTRSSSMDSFPTVVSRSSLDLSLGAATECNSILFSAGNEDPDLPPCLIHLLMQLVRVEQRNLNATEHGTNISPPSSAPPPKVDVSVKPVETQVECSSGVKDYYRTAFCEVELETCDENASPKLNKVVQSVDQVDTPLVCQTTTTNESSSVSAVNSNLVVQAALQLWSECYLAKKTLIATLVPDTPLVSGLSVPSLTDWAPVLEAPCLMAWAQHVDSEAAGTGGTGPETLWGRIPGPPMADLLTVAPGLASSPPLPQNGSIQGSSISGLHHQISLRLSRLPGGVFKFGSGTQSASGTPPTATPRLTESATGPTASNTTPSISQIFKSCVVAHHVQTPNLESVREALEVCVPNQLAYLRDMLEQQRKQHHRNMGFIHRRLELEWDKMELELTRERGLWGPTHPDLLMRWKLDPTEGPCRMRKRMIPNPTFYMRYPYHPSLQGRNSIHGKSGLAGSVLPYTLRCRQARSRFSQLYFLNYQSRSILQEDWGPLAPWLPLLAKQGKTGHASRTLPISHPADLDTLETNESDEGPNDELEQQDDLETSLRRSLDPEELDQSLKNTVSLLRLTGKSPSYAPAETDDVDEVIAPSGNEPGGMESIQEEHFREPLDEDQSVDGPDESSPSVGSVMMNEPVKSDNVSSEPTAPNSMPSYSSVTIDDDKQLASNDAILRLLEPGERPTVMYRCARILGLDVYEGLLLFGQAHFYVIDGYTLINTREIVDIDSLPPDVIHEPVVPCMHGASNTNTVRGVERTSVGSHVTDLWSTGAVSQTSGKQYFKFPYENIQDVYKRRYLLQPIALEVFNTDGRNFLLAFSKGLQGKVYQRFQNVAVLNSISLSLMNQKNTPSLLSSLLGEKTVTKRWERGELSNFQYLMYLNTQAGRSYNDLMQYPIFPWVLADYDSEELDLTCPETFRDFSKPMGAQTPRRLQQFHRRFKEWDDPTGETPPYYYGTHYSSAMIVASYLVRMEPFTQQFLRLQGGHFDLPDRMFHSVKHAWLSASEQNMADVRELIPEFFYLPDFLVNANQFELGLKQNGRSVDDVSLPPWAKSDPREFIRAHREALESEYVSAHLHEWIDLIFGHKQQGDAAVLAYNVFHHLFYEGNVDIYSIDDPLKRSAVIGFINNFGQIPKQLFRKPHPSRRIAVPRGISAIFLGSAKKPTSGTQIAEDLFYQNIDCLRPHLQPLKELKHAVGQIVQLDPSVIPSGSGGSAPSSAVVPSVGGSNTGGSTGGGVGVVFTDGFSTPPCNSSGPITLAGASIVAVEQNKCLLPPHHTAYVAWGFTDGSLRLSSPFDPLDRARSVFEMVDQAEILCCTAPNDRILITAGISTVVRVWKVRYADAQTSRSGQPATAAATGHDNTSGSAQVGPGTTGSSTNSNTPPSVCQLQLKANLCGHTEAVTCLAASNAFNLVVSGSRDRTCILWDLTRLCFLRQLTGHVAPIAAVCISEATGDIASCAGTYLYLWNCNGEPIASVDTIVGRNKQILCVCMSTLYDWDAGNVVLTGGSDGVVRMWGLEYTRLSYDPPNEDTRQQESSTSVVKQPVPVEVMDIVHEPTSVDAACSKSFNATSQHGATPTGDQLISEQPSWTRELAPRGKLTMHTAYGRSDNQQPASITALAISRDHRSVLVGDSRGRVHAWSVPSEAGRGGMTDQWVRDEDVTNCAADTCSVRFSLTERKHHCRNCGKVFCSKCSRFETEIRRLRIFKRVRVCQACFTMLNLIQAPKLRPPSESTRVDS
ncbi:hypothetical protein CRM22_003482 [Opisthorchis felineus]|uniref:WD repeat and FYVE domain-containing protein 3 n=1 Tax=Opisthorchis felineus TaxID=147828 RepID=A0A4S2M102_OPIFE|nr:hypothetical protein CRM22_003482 [Opisthorchis felineus]